ncbi:MAG: hypothetical protein AB8G23_09805 [Myxococcota bacterium]
MVLSEQHRHFLRVEQCIHPFLFNFVINGVIAWLVTRSHETLPLWGEGGIGVDLIATSILLPLLTAIIVSRVIRGQINKGKIARLDPAKIETRGLHHRPAWIRGLVLAAAVLAFAGGPLVLLLHLAQAQPVDTLSFVGFKALWAGGVAMLISPIIAWWALCAASTSDLAPETGVT